MQTWVERQDTTAVPLTPEVVADPEALYTADVAADDESFGVLLDALRAPCARLRGLKRSRRPGAAPGRVRTA